MKKTAAVLMRDEVTDLFTELALWANVVMQSEMGDRIRICAAYDAGLQLIAERTPPGSLPRPGIEACILQHQELKAAEDISCVGWILAAIATRVGERDLPKWEEAQKVIDITVRLLSRYRQTCVH
ncbi:hypothetical protein NKH10_25060 [Mesorhizobium sp. M1340]|uniref:hypothetical protein n=2 Tax=unclassified Mesorhizobium TaxID=325217 RepID=UPI003337D72F